jgi:N-methylhydantoinase A
MKVGIDVGGTFTDLFAFDPEDDHRVLTAKVSSTPRDFTDGVMHALAAADISPSDVSTLVHGSTIATNAVIERRFPPTAFLTTAGFRDLVQIGRYHRPRLYDPYGRKPQPLIPRRHIYEVPERVGARGEVVQPLEESALDAIVDDLRTRCIESVGVAFLNAYANPAHERQARARLAKFLPSVPVALSSDVSPKVGALGRFVTTMLSSALRPVAGSYVDRLSQRLAERGFTGALWFIVSNGGMMTAGEVRHRPEHMFISGPAGGVQGAIEIGRLLATGNLITMDMGGTSCDVTIIEDGQPFITSSYEIDFDMPVTIPMIDIRTIGAGGGSIAVVDAGHMLQVGPRSAGADPGPACYGRGGVEPTVTDANLVLGYLDADRFLGGDMPLAVDAAHRAIDAVASQLRLDTVEAALGVIRIVNENMAAAIREVSVDRGRDPRDYTLLPFGGAGPVHALALADIIGIQRVVVPPDPEVLSAFGATALDVKHDAEVTHYAELDHVDPATLEGRFSQLEREALRALERQGIAHEQCSIERTVEMRYVGQTYDVAVQAPVDITAPDALDNLANGFHAAHEHLYGVADADAPVAVVNLRATAVGPTVKPPVGRGAHTTPAPPERRRVFFPHLGWTDTPVYWRHDLLSGSSLLGPVIIEQRGSTFVVPRGWKVQVDRATNLVATRDA